MTARAPDGLPAPLPAVRGAPLLVVAVLPPPVFVWADAIRRAHYPPTRNRLGAHVTLFHGLPPSAQDEVQRLLAATAASHAPPEARFRGIMDLGQGTAFAIDSPAVEALHAQLADRLTGVIQQKDDRPLRLHVTVQNKVSREVARALQRELATLPLPPPFRLPALATRRWDGEAWRFEREWRFRR